MNNNNNNKNNASLPALPSRWPDTIAIPGRHTLGHDNDRWRWALDYGSKLARWQTLVQACVE